MSHGLILARVLDAFFVVFHTALIAFVLTGWIWRRTRRAHLVVVGLVVLSWVGLGAFYGWGYCPCTDWHWRVKRRLGETNLPSSYVTYYLDRLAGHAWNPALVDHAVAVVGVTALVVSAWLNWRDWSRARGGKPA